MFEPWVLGIALKPLVVLGFFAIAILGRLAVQKWMKPGKLKNFLLLRT